MKTFKINDEQGQAIINYLSTCPYGQVFQLVQMLVNLEEIKETKDETK